MKEKICVFCGRKPESKNKEHIIPKWLIKMTGDEKRIGNWGIDYYKLIFEEDSQVHTRKYPFLKYTFPACEKCNSEYGENLEVEVKNVLEKIHSNMGLVEEDVLLLLDWFDKVRIGMWLGYLYYNSEDAIEPKFSINNRIGTCDRALFIFKADCTNQGLNIVGPGSMLFSRLPIIMGMKINEYYYISISTDFLISREVGFPVPSEVVTNREGNIGIESLQEGNEKIEDKEIWKKFFSIKPEIAFIQPIYKKYYMDFKDVYKTEYIKSSSKNAEQGIGHVFYYNDSDWDIFPKDRTQLVFKGTYLEKNLQKRLVTIVSKYLIKTAKQLQLENGSEEVTAEINMAIAYQNFLMRDTLDKLDNDKIC